MKSRQFFRSKLLLLILTVILGIIIAGILLLVNQSAYTAGAPTATWTVTLPPSFPPTSTTIPTPSSPTTSPTVTPTPPAIHSSLSPVATPTPSVTPTPYAPSKTIIYTYRIINTYPHDREAFTQGLIFLDGVLYEGTGRHGQSSLRRVDLATGEVLQFHALPTWLFGEGITIFGDKIIQLTWKANIGFIYDRDNFTLERWFAYPTEGWGITHDGERLIMSDGSSTLHFWDPVTLEENGRVEVYDDNGPVVRLNELEYINGEVYANVWQTDRIARIDPETGRVVGWIELGGLLTEEDLSQPVNWLNGIAYDAENDRLFVTGKLWPKLFELELIPLE